MSKLYKSGQLINVYDFPFDPKAEREEGKSKGRPAIVLGYHDDHIEAIPVMQIGTKGGKTEKPSYLLFPEEVRVPKGLTYLDNRELRGVIKTNRIEIFKESEVTEPLDDFPLRTKIDVLQTYESIKNTFPHKDELNRYGNNHQEVMEKFKENTIADQLNFLVDKNGENQFEFKKNNLFEIDKIQPVEREKGLHTYSIGLSDGESSYLYTISTSKKPKQIIKDWAKPKTAEEWLKEDTKFQALSKNIDYKLKPTPLPHPDKYKNFTQFKNQELRKLKRQELER
ncbi:hypothetical protein [Metabacillus fastidiosus]|uniref:hypothetical protein n=1 Tax=Metabacillus fastidiosus TaxID=1458 RepID=UPI003D2A8585